MADVKVVLIGPSELPIIVELYNEVFRPARDLADFDRRLKGRTNPLILLAQIEDQPIGFGLGYETKPGTFYCWLIGVLPDCRRSGVASQLMEALAAWAADNKYQIIRFECYNRQRPMLHLAIHQNYDIVGIRYDSDASDNLLILEHLVSEPLSEE